MKQLETFGDIINAGKALKYQLTRTFGFPVLNGDGTNGEAGFSIKKEEIVFSFPYGPVINEETKHCPIGYRKKRLEVYDFSENKTLMTKEQFMELFEEYFGDDVEYEEFEWSDTWGLRVPLKANKAVGEIWKVRSTSRPEKQYVLYKTEKTITVGDTLDDFYPQRLNLSDVIGTTYFWTYEEAYEQYKANIEKELRQLEEKQQGIARRIETLNQLKSQFH